MQAQSGKGTQPRLKPSSRFDINLVNYLLSNKSSLVHYMLYMINHFLLLKHILLKISLLDVNKADSSFFLTTKESDEKSWKEKKVR